VNKVLESFVAGTFFGFIIGGIVSYIFLKDLVKKYIDASERIVSKTEKLNKELFKSIEALRYYEEKYNDLIRGMGEIEDKLDKIRERIIETNTAISDLDEYVNDLYKLLNRKVKWNIYINMYEKRDKNKGKNRH